MKKSLFSLILIFLAYFFTINHAYCEEDFFLDSNFQAAKGKTEISAQKVAKNIEKTKKKWSLFNKKTKEEEEQQGYYGTLPDIEADFKYKNKKTEPKTETQMKIPSEDELEEESLKEAPFDDSLFLDKVIKKQTDSQYLNDIQKSKYALSNLKKCIEEHSDIQRFNAAVNVLELYVQNLKTKYENSSESLKESYIELLNTNYYAKLLGNLKYDSNYYARYVPTNQGQYSKENISLEEEKLLNRINKTLFLLNNEI